MGFFQQLFEPRSIRLTDRVWRTIQGYTTASGIHMTPDHALQVSTVYTCVKILSESVAQLPLVLYRRGPDGSKHREPTHPLYKLLLTAPNEEMTAFEFRELLMVHLCLRGNAYVEIVWGLHGHVVELWPLHPDLVQPFRGDDNELYYQVTTGYAGNHERQKQTRTLHASRVMHIRNLGTDGIMGLSPIALHRQGIGLAAATEAFGSRFFGNDARPGGIITHPGKLSQQAHSTLSATWESRHMGLDKSHRTAVLEEGMTYQQIGVNPEEAQFLQTRGFQVKDVARIFRVPLHMVGDLEHATFSNIEHQAIGFVVHTLGPWLVRIEQAVARDLLLPSEQDLLYVDFMVDALLRGDIQSRYQAYTVGRTNGWLSANDIRRMENMNTIEGGDIYLVPLNMTPADQMVGANSADSHLNSAEFERMLRTLDSQLNSADSHLNSAEFERMLRTLEARAAADQRHRLLPLSRRLFSATAQHILKREAGDVVQAARDHFTQRSVGEFKQWMQTFYDEFKPVIVQRMLPPATAYSESVAEAVRAEGHDHDHPLDRWLRAYLDLYATRHVELSKMQLARAMERAQADGGDLLAAIEETIGGWEDGRAETIAAEESVRLNNAVAVTIYAAVGVRYLRWHAFGRSCPYCTALNGRIVGIADFFLPAGVEFQPEGATVMLKPSINIRHAPAHRGCDCMVTAG